MMQHDLNRFAESHLARCENKSAVQTLRAIVTTLNHVGPRLGLQQFQQPTPYVDQKHLAFAPEFHQPEFLADIASAARSLTSLRAPWRTVTRDAEDRIAARLLHCAGAGCRGTGRDPRSIIGVQDLCELAFARAAIDHVMARHEASGRINHPAGAYQAARLICAVAEYYLDPNQVDLIALRALRLEHAPEAMRELSADKQATLRACAEVERSRHLRRLPREVYARLGTLSPPSQRELVAALGLELGLKNGLWPFMIVGCVLRRSCEPHDPAAVAEIVTDTMQLVISKTNRSAARTFDIAGHSRDIVERYIAEVRPRHARALDSTYLFPGRVTRGASASSLSAAIADLITPAIGSRVTASHLPHIAAAITLLSPQGSRETARILLGRSYAKADCVFDTIEAWANVARCDRLILTRTS